MLNERLDAEVIYQNIIFIVSLWKFDAEKFPPQVYLGLS